MTTTVTQHPVHRSLEKHRIHRVAVVDDAFDTVSLASLQEGEDQEFIDAVNEDDTLLKEFHKLVSNKDSDELLAKDALTDATVGLIWDKRAALGALGPVVARTLFRVLEQKVSQVEKLSRFSRTILASKRSSVFARARRFQTTSSISRSLTTDSVRPGNRSQWIARVRWAMHLYQNGKAFIILMSVEMEARVQQELFRRKSELTRGLFEFVDKKEIKDSGKLSNRLNSFCTDSIHATKSTSSRVPPRPPSTRRLPHSKNRCMLLDWKTLLIWSRSACKKTGIRWATTCCGCSASTFAHKLSVNASLQPARNLVNGLKYERFLPLQRPPSVMLAKMYSSAITEPVHEGWNPHPRDVQETTTGPSTQPVAAAEAISPPEGEASVAPEVAQTPAGGAMGPTDTPPPSPSAEAKAVTAENPQGATVQATTGIVFEVQADALPSTKGMPLYQLGDLLIADRHKPAFLILNAGCDLQFSPGKRDCDPQRTILLVPGRFEPLYERGDEKNVKRTELFELDEERFRIIWQHTHVRGMPCYQVRPEHEPNGYTRKWRLKLPYALEVQQHFASQLTRVGVPTPTPLFRERPVEIYGKAANGDCCHLRTIPNGMIVFHHRDRDQFVLTVDCVQ